DLLRKVAVGDGGGDFGHVSQLHRQVAGHEIDVIREVLPGAGNAFDDRLPAEFSFGTHFAGHARDFRGEGGELIDHRVDGVFQFENLALDVDRDFLGEVAIGDGGGYRGDIADLRGQVGRHQVH